MSEIYCNNCGLKGHMYKDCKQPVLSCGNLIFRKDKAVDTNIEKASGTLTGDTLPLQEIVTFSPIFSVAAGSCDIARVGDGFYNSNLSVRLWNTQKPFVLFDSYEVESPHDAITITFSDGRTPITA